MKVRGAGPRPQKGSSHVRTASRAHSGPQRPIDKDGGLSIIDAKCNGLRRLELNIPCLVPKKKYDRKSAQPFFQRPDSVYNRAEIMKVEAGLFAISAHRNGAWLCLQNGPRRRKAPIHASIFEVFQKINARCDCSALAWMPLFPQRGGHF